jgi:hypothetical protein
VTVTAATSYHHVRPTASSGKLPISLTFPCQLANLLRKTLRIIGILCLARPARAARRTRPPYAAALAPERRAAATTPGRGRPGPRRSRGAGAGAAGVADGLLGRPTAAPAFHSNDLVVQRPQVHPVRRPRFEVVLDGDGAAGSRGVPHGDVLVEGRCAHDGRLVDTLVLIDRVGPSIARDRPLHLAKGGRAVGVLYDVVLNKGVGGPAIDGEEAGSARGRERTTKANGAAMVSVNG